LWLRKDRGLGTVSCRRAAGTQTGSIGKGRVLDVSDIVVWILITGDVAEVESWFWATHAAYGRATAAGSCSGIDGRGRIGERLRWSRALRNVGVVVGKGRELKNKCEEEVVVRERTHRVRHGSVRRGECEESEESEESEETSW